MDTLQVVEEVVLVIWAQDRYLWLGEQAVLVVVEEVVLINHHRIGMQWPLLPILAVVEVVVLIMEVAQLVEVASFSCSTKSN